MSSTALIPYVSYGSSFDFIKNALEQTQKSIFQRMLRLEESFLNYSKVTILCIDVGHTRFKAANLILPITLGQIRKIKTIEGSSIPWLKSNLHLLFKQSTAAPLSSLLNQHLDMISLSLFGPILNHSHHLYWAYNGISEHLKESLEKEASCRVMIESDALSWAIGALEYLKFNLESTSIHFPCLAVTLGTGVGVALIENANKIIAIEIWAMNPFYPKLSQFLTYSDLDSPRRLLEKEFLEKISTGEKKIDEKMETYRSTYNQHFQAFLDDICKELEGNFCLPKPILSILVGGGFSRFINDLNSNIRNTIILNPKHLKERGLSPDIVPLLGCLRNCQMPQISTTTYPPVTDMNRLLKGDVLANLYNHQTSIRKLFNVDGYLKFEKLTGGIVNAPVYVFQTDKTFAGVFKYEKNPSFAEKRLRAIAEIKESGFEHLPCILKNKNGEYLTKLGKTTYSCIEYLEPDSNQTELQKQLSFEDMLVLTSKFHTYAKKNSLANDLRKSKLDQYLARMFYFSDPCLLQWDLSLFATNSWKKISEIASYFSSELFQEIYRRLPTQLIHGDNAPTNLIFSKGKPFFIDLDAVRTDIRLLDFAVFTGWNYLEKYVELVKENRLLSCIETHYGNLEEIEKKHFHTIVLFRQMEFLAWILKMLKQSLSDQDKEKLKEFKELFIRHVKQINQMLNTLEQSNLDFKVN